jgi:hypothetical protein
MRGAASGCVADEIGKILLANLAELRCTAIESVKDPASAFSRTKTHSCRQHDPLLPGLKCRIDHRFDFWSLGRSLWTARGIGTVDRVRGRLDGMARRPARGRYANLV